jgi:hypothetical protein
MAITPSPSDNTTLTAVLSDYAAAGFDGQFSVTDDGDDGVRCTTCGTISDPSIIELLSLRRLEGASDPADMSAVLALVCPACHQHGTLVVMFGPESSAVEAELLQRVRDHRFDDNAVPGAAAPGEVTATEGTAPDGHPAR